MNLPRRISPRSWIVPFFATALGMSMGAPRAQAIIINGEANATGIYDRFIVGTYPGTPLNPPVENPSFIGAALDLSGVGWSSTNAQLSITMVSSQYFVFASHNPPGIGVTLNFLGTDDLLYSATVASYSAISYTNSLGATFTSDLKVGRLTTALPAAVKPLPIYYAGTTNVSTPTSFLPYEGLSLFNYGHAARMGSNLLDGVDEFSFSGPPSNIGLFYDLDVGVGETLLESGDSGSPTFAYANGIYGLIGTHSGVDAPVSADAFVAYTPYVDQINAILATDGQTLSFVPEPSTLLLGLAVVGMCGARRMRRAPQDRGRGPAAGQ